MINLIEVDGNIFEYTINEDDCWIPLNAKINKYGTPICNITYKDKKYTRLYSLVCTIYGKVFNKPSHIKFLCKNRNCINPNHITDCEEIFYNHTEKNKKYERLTVVGYNVEKSKNSKYTYIDCLCECGKNTTVVINSLKNGKTKSCGCLMYEKSRKTSVKHNKYNSRIYKIYHAMKQRCYNEKHLHYKNYGGRCIKVCDEWLGENGFNCFYEWAMSNGYKDDLTIERIDVNGNYCKENCEWITNNKQQYNKSTTVRVDYLGKEYSLKLLLKELGRVNEIQNIRRYMKIYDFTLEQALSVKNERDITLTKYENKLIKNNVKGKINKNELAECLNLKVKSLERYLFMDDFKFLLNKLNIEVLS